MASLSNTAKYRKLTALGCKIKIFIYLYFQIKTSDFRFACAVGNINHVIKNCMLKDYHMINIPIQTCILIIIASILYFISELLY